MESLRLKRRPWLRETLVQVRAPHFTAGIVMAGDRCITAAPILRSACLGKSTAELRILFADREWTAVIVP